LFGSGMTNFRRIAEELLAHGAARQVTTPKDLALQVTRLFHDAPQRQALAKAAAAWHRENAGAIDRTWRIIRAELARTNAK
jgi:3-deoxy-D-manno-octulosonic-acid transferase